MKQITLLSQPYSDDNLEWNPNSGRYELTLQFLKDQFGESYKNDEVAKRRLKLNSQVVYYYINAHVASWNREVVNFLLHKTEEGRKFLLEILSAQIYADLQTAYNDTMFISPINFNGQDKDRNEIRRNALCLAAEDVFQNSDTFFGIRIGYQGQFPPFFYLFVRQNS